MPYYRLAIEGVGLTLAEQGAAGFRANRFVKAASTAAAADLAIKLTSDLWSSGSYAGVSETQPSLHVDDVLQIGFWTYLTKRRQNLGGHVFFGI